MLQAKRSHWIGPVIMAYLGAYQVALAFLPQLMRPTLFGVGIGLSPIRIRPTGDPVDITALGIGLALLTIAATGVALATWRRPIYWQIWLPLSVFAPVFAAGYGIVAVMLLNPEIQLRHQAPTLSVAEREAIRPCLEAQQDARASLAELRLAIRRCEAAYQTVDPQSEASHVAVRYITQDYRRLDHLRALGAE